LEDPAVESEEDVLGESELVGAFMSNPSLNPSKLDLVVFNSAVNIIATAIMTTMFLLKNVVTNPIKMKMATELKSRTSTKPYKNTIETKRKKYNT
jgi:hypothetical protein